MQKEVVTVIFTFRKSLDLSGDVRGDEDLSITPQLTASCCLEGTGSSSNFAHPGLYTAFAIIWSSFGKRKLLASIINAVCGNSSCVKPDLLHHPLLDVQKIKES